MMSEYDDAAKFMDQIGETMRLMMDAKTNQLDEEPRTEVYAFKGPSEAEALGNAYHIRDVLRANGYQATADLLGATDFDWADVQFYEVALHINGGGD